MKRFLAGAALLGMIGAAHAQTFAPRIAPFRAGGSGTWSTGPSNEFEDNARRLADTRSIELSNLPTAPDAGASSAEGFSDAPKSSLPLAPILGGVLGVAVVAVGLGSRSKLARLRN